MRRIAVIVGVAVGLILAPAAADAQPGQVPRIGYLALAPDAKLLEAFRQGLHELGYVEAQNIAIERRYSEGRAERVFDLATSLVRRSVDDLQQPPGRRCPLGGQGPASAFGSLGWAPSRERLTALCHSIQEAPEECQHLPRIGHP